MRRSSVALVVKWPSDFFAYWSFTWDHLPPSFARMVANACSTVPGSTAGSPVNHGVTVVGGGLAGLVAAIECAEAGATVTLFEAHSLLGGRARSTDGPFVANSGPTPSTTTGPLGSGSQRATSSGGRAAVPSAG